MQEKVLGNEENQSMTWLGQWAQFMLWSVVALMIFPLLSMQIGWYAAYVFSSIFEGMSIYVFAFLFLTTTMSLYMWDKAPNATWIVTMISALLFLGEKNDSLMSMIVFGSVAIAVIPPILFSWVDKRWHFMDN